jgi:hypothetical protein
MELLERSALLRQLQKAGWTRRRGQRIARLVGDVLDVDPA